MFHVKHRHDSAKSRKSILSEKRKLIRCQRAPFHKRENDKRPLCPKYFPYIKKIYFIPHPLSMRPFQSCYNEANIKKTFYISPTMHVR